MLVTLALVILLMIILLILLLRPAPAPPKPEPPTPPSPPSHIPQQFDEPALAKTLAVRLVGTPADGSRVVLTAAPPRGPVIWVDHGDEVLVHFEDMQVRMLDGVILVSIDFETDQTGRTPLVVSIALGKSGPGAGLLAATDEYPRGNGILASRWGAILQDAVWSSLLGLAKDHAMQTGQAPRAIGITAGKLTLQAGIPLQASNPS